MGTYSNEEVAEAFAEFRRRGVGSHDWPGWAQIFTDDALYEEHNLGVFQGQKVIEDWIVAEMAKFPGMTLWIEWFDIDNDHVCFYIWNNLPDPSGSGASYQFPNTTMLRYAGDGKFDWEADFYNPADAERVFGEWFRNGGRPRVPGDRSLKGIEGWLPEPVSTVFPREEIEREFQAYRARGAHAVATGDWHQWADQFTDDARYREHHFGRFNSQQEIRDWITGVMKPFPTMTFPVTVHTIVGNRVCAIIPNVLPDPTGGDGYFAFDVNVILHYAGNGKWSYEEDVYNPREAELVVRRWVAAGGVIEP